MPKRSIRSQFLAQRKSLSAEVCKTLSGEIQKQLIDSVCFDDVACVALYSAVNNEVHTTMVADFVLGQSKKLAYPRVRKDKLDFFEVVDADDFTVGSFGVLEPRGGELVPVNELDLVVVPGVVFDMAGHRLGYGKGYYDRALDACRGDCKKVGVAYDFQVTGKLPTLEHDQVLTMLVTEKRTLLFKVS